MQLSRQGFPEPASAAFLGKDGAVIPAEKPGGVLGLVPGGLLRAWQWAHLH